MKNNYELKQFFKNTKNVNKYMHSSNYEIHAKKKKQNTLTHILNQSSRFSSSNVLTIFVCLAVQDTYFYLTFK